VTTINDKCEHCHETGGNHYWDCWYDCDCPKTSEKHDSECYVSQVAADLRQWIKCPHCHETGGKHNSDCYYDQVMRDALWIPPSGRGYAAQENDCF